ncbi:PAS domain S-box protein [Microcoleus sp. herbarium7]|uniref:PAS domain S-box protein n=1 Tax=Microcoleus sp. herbarium7 TaxID=3055435 RepID=UPI002FD0560D
MKNYVQNEVAIDKKVLNFLQLLLIKFNAAVTRIQKAECRRPDEKKISRATIAPGSVFCVSIAVLLVLNWLLVAGSSGDNLYDRPIALGFFASIANIVLLAVSARSNASAVAAGSDRNSSKPDGGDRFFSISPDMLCVVGFDGYFKRVNPAAEKILGYSEAEMVGKLFTEFVHPDDREATLKEAESIAAGNNAVGFENRWQCRNQSYKWVAWTVSPFCEEELMYGIGREITDRKCAQESLQQTNSILRSVIESTPDVIFVKDIHGRYAIANSAFAEFVKKPIAEIIGKKDTELFPPELAAKFIEDDRRIMTAGECLTYEEKVSKTGEMETMLTTKSPWQDAEGNMIGVIGISRDISDRKEIEAALLESNILFENVIESTGDSIFVKDTTSRYLLVNSTAAGIMGKPKSEIIGKNDAELFGPEIAEMLVENDRRIWQSGLEETIEEVVKDSEGNILTVLSTKSPLRDRAGNIAGVVGVARDISDRKLAEKALQESEQRYRCLIAATSQIVWDTTARGEIVTEQPGWSAFTGQTYGEYKGWEWLNAIHPDDREYTARIWSDAVANCTSYQIEHRLHRHDGEYRYMSGRGVPVLNADGSVREWVGVHSDITDRKITEEEIQQQKEFLRTIYDSVDYSIFVIDVGTDGKFRYAGWNRSAELLGNISSECGCGKTPEELFPAPTAAFFQEKLRECLLENSSIYYEEAVTLDTKEVCFMTTLTPLRDELGKICRIVGSATDITERKKAEAQLREQEEFLNSIYNGADQVIFVVDVGTDGEFRYAGWNAATEASTSISSAEIKGKTPEEIFPPNVAADFRQRYIDCLAAGSSISYENSAELAGVEYWFVVALTPLRDASGRIYRLIGNSTDITERKKAEAALQASQRFIERIANATPNILYVYDEQEQRNVYANREITSILGYTVEEVQALGSNMLPTIIHPDDFAKVPAYIQELENAPDGEVIEYEYRVRNKDNSWRWLVSRETVFSRTASGKIQQRLGAATDVSDRKQAEQALAEQLKLSVFTAEVGIALTQNPTLTGTLQNCCDAVVLYLDAALARIWTLNEAENVLELQASGGMYTHIDGAHSRIAVGHLKIGLIAKERIPYLSNQVREDDRIGDKEWAAREGMVAFAGYPLVVDDRLVGVLAMFSRQKLNESTLIALASVADAIALGIKRKQAEEALARQQQTLRSIIDNAPIWVWMANASGRMLLVNKTFCEDVGIPESRFLAASHYSEVLGLEASANCMASDVQAWSQDTPCYAEEILQLADGKEHFFETIKSQVKDAFGNSMGLIGLGLDVTQEREAKRKLQDSEARFRKLAEQEALLNQLASNIRASLDLDTILATTVNQIRELLQLDRCLFIWYQADASPPVWDVRYEAKNPDLRSLLGLYPTDATGSHAARIANLEIIRIDDFDTVTDPVERDFFRSIGFNSLLNIPIQTPSGQIGLICCGGGPSQRRWRDEEVELLMAVGTQLAIALNQSELYEKSRLAAAEAKTAAMQQKLLNQLASQIRASLDLDTVLATTVRQIREFLQVDRCMFIWYLPDAAPPAWDVVHEAKNDDLFSLLGYFPADITGTLPQKIASLEVYQIDDITTVSDDLEREFLLQLGYKSVLDLPIKSAGGLTGVVGCVSCSEMRRWTKEEVELIGAIGAQLSIAISQSELYTQSVDSARIAQEQAKKLEVALAELQQAQTQLVQSEKMSSLGQMVAGIAHEINNPVSFIFGNLTYTEEYTASLMKLLQMYRDEYPEPTPAIREEIDALELDFLLDDLPKMLSSMQVGATRIRDIVRSLRNFSRLDESEMKNVNIHEGIDSTLMILEHRLKAQPVSAAGTEYHRPAIQVVKEYGQLPLVECYAGLLNQVFMNIIANAIDVLQEPLENPGVIRIRTEVEGNFAAVRIADNGAGITDKVKQRIFDPFFTTKPIGSGTGMGLAISHSIVVEKHKGEIKCLSAVGKGSEFILKVPIKRIET